MAIVTTNVLSETDSGAASSSVVTSGTFAVDADTLYTVHVNCLSDSAAWTGSPTLTGGGASSWTLDTSVAAFSNRLGFVFRSVDASPGSAAALTFTAPGAETYSYLAIDALKNVGATATGTNGADAFVQVKTTTQGAGTANATTATFDSGMTAGNGAIASFANFGSNYPSTPRSGWTELSDHGIAGNMSAVTHWRDDTDTAAAADYGITSGARVGIAVEIEAAAAASGASGPLVGTPSGRLVG